MTVTWLFCKFTFHRGKVQWLSELQKVRLGHSIMLYATLDIELCQPLKIRAGFCPKPFLGGAAMHTPNRHLSFIFSYFHNLAWSYCGEFLGCNIWKEKNSNFVKTSQWFGHQCWKSCEEFPIVLGRLPKILVTGSQRQENLIASMGSLYVHGTWMSHIVIFQC